MNKLFSKIVLITALLLTCIAMAQEYTPFTRTYPSGNTYRYQNNIKGDLTFIANNIVNRSTNNSTPQNPYNATGNASTYNDWLNMQYIDVDSDATTFSSSSATLNFPNPDCNQIRYAALYWSATYPSAQAGQAIGTNRQTDFNQVKLQVPGGTYVDITADEILFDGFTSADASVRQNSPYACYADITGQITALANPTGQYTVANIRSVVGSLSPGGGAAGGWTLVIVYENPTLSGKLITTFDGFARVRTQNPSVDINYSGFNTIPVGPVRANIGAAALEGDNRIPGDRMQISSGGNPFTNISNGTNPANNFFNSNITLDGAILTNRTPNSVNTLGYDTDVFLLNNVPNNNRIANNATSATFRFRSTGDQYYPFFNSFNVEIIEPNIVVEKKVEDIAGNDITGAGVNLGQLLDYVLTFENTGNDGATNYTLRDKLPINVTFIPADLVLPTGVTYVYDPVEHEITFSIPPALVAENEPAAQIRLRVRVAENCFDFIDACTDQIQNLAYSTYQGVTNNNQITDDPSVSDFNACGFITPGATNFLLDDLEDCDFSRTVQLCGDDVLLDSGDGFDDYIWYKDENGNRVIDGSDTVLNDGNTDNDLSTLLVDEVGIYIVDKIVADPCKGFQEIITVELFGATQSNPISALINDTTNTVEGEITICPVDGDPLPKIFLCGLNDTEPVTINIPDATSIEWEQLDEGSCTASVDDCANKNGTCTWNNVANGNTFLATDPGQYRLIINYQNGCFSRFYFNVFKNPLDPQYNSRDVICTTPGNITVTNMPADYEYQLLDATNGNIIVPFSANNGPVFSIATNGAYSVEMRQQGVVDGCIFRLEDIGILTRDFQVDITTKDTDCNGLGEITISATGVEPQYYYEISQGGTTVDTFGPDNDNNYTFENLNDGVYDVLITTDDGCSYTEQVTINDVTDLAGTAVTTKQIDCTSGIITVTGTGGYVNPDYVYAIWSHNGTDLYTDINDIPANEFQVNNDFTFGYDVDGNFVAGEDGSYEFVVVDANSCFVITNSVDIIVAPAITYTTTVTDENCSGAEDGAFAINVTNTNGYTLSYNLLYPDTTTISNSSGNFTDLPQGNYVLTITQTNGTAVCDTVENFTIGGPIDGVTGTAVLTQDYTCLQNATIEAQTVSGGATPYEYSIDGVNFVNGVGAETFTNLTDGNYTITIRDANGCTFETNEITVDPLNPPTDLTFSATAPNCPTQTSNVTATVINGNAPFTFEIIAPSAIASTSVAGNIATFNGLAPDTYTYRVTDAKGCVYEETNTISPVAPISVIGTLVSNISCFSDTDGEATFTVSGFATSFDYSISGPSTSNGTAETNGTINLTNLDDGTYTITVTDTDSNCTATTDVTISAPAAVLALTVADTQPSCTADGSVTLTATGGWGGNSFTITYPDGTTSFTNTTGVFNSLNQSGVHNVSVEDANGCIVTDNFSLTAAVAPSLEIVANDICYDDATGLTLTANVTAGGNGTYEYRLNGGAYVTGNTFTSLTPGTHTIDVIDGNNCTGTASITINPELSITATAANITACATDTDVTITAAGGDGNYIYAIVADGATPTAGDFAATNPISVTGAGDYDVYVRDKNGATDFCEASYDITIAQDAAITVTPSKTDVSCFGGNDGTISLVIANGAAPYEYSIDDGTTYQTTASFNGLSAATYSIRVKDANDCEATASITVNQNPQIVAEVVLTQDYTCLQEGEITVGSVTPTSGGSGDYQYSIDGSTWTASTTGGTVFTNITDGSYTIQVRDANNTSCAITLTAFVVDPLPTAPTLTSSIAYSCDGTGSITILPNDATYTYAIDGNPAQPGNVFNNIAIGLHNIVVDYGKGCTVDIDVQVEAGNAFGANITSFDNLDCNADNTGSITFEVENFNAVTGFEYSVNGAAYVTSLVSPVTVTGLAAINNTIDVRDINDNTCAIPLAQTLTEPAVIVASASITTEFMCSNTGATITASAVGGTPAYMYQLEDTVGGVVRAYQTSTEFINVPAGSYIVRARDTNLCNDPIDAAITVVAPETIVFDTTPTACYTGNNDGQIVVNVTAGNGDYQFRIDGGPWMNPNVATPTTYTFANLANGSYDIEVKDGLGCPNAPNAQTVVLDANLVAIIDVVDLTSCADGSITVNATGGDGNYAYAFVPNGNAVVPGDFGASNTFAITTGNDGDYDVYVRDNNGTNPFCENQQTVTVNGATPITFTAIATDPTCHDGTGNIAINVTSGIAPYTYQIIDLDNAGASNQTNTNVVNDTKTYYNLATGDYTINVTDASGCLIAQTPVTINNPDELVADVESILSDDCAPATGFRFISYTTTLTGTLQFSHDGGTTWQTSDTFEAPTHTLTSGDAVNPSIRTVDVSNNELCRLDLPQYIIEFPLDDLDISITTVVKNCNELEVTVQGNEGTAPYQYTYTDDPANFNLITPANPWTTPAKGLADPEVFSGLVPGRTYVFYVRDANGCIRQSNQNVAELQQNPIEIDATFEPSCFGANDAEITYTLTDNVAPTGPDMRWEFFDINGNIVRSSGNGTTPAVAGINITYASTITVTGLAAGEYYIVVTEVDGVGVDSCVSGSENLIVDELDAITGTPNTLRDITCNTPGLIEIPDISGGGGTYTYTLTSASFTGAITGATTNPIEVPISQITTPNPASVTVTVSVEDQFGCAQNLGDVTLNISQPPTIDSFDVANCATPSSLQINATNTSGAASVLYSIDGGTTYLDNGGLFTNITAGTYNVSIIDSNGCTDTDTVTVEPILEANVSLTKLLDCSATPDAQITIDVLSGSGNYDYEITNGLGGVVARQALPSDPFVANVTVAETYTITIYDNNTTTPECNRVFVIDVPAAVTPIFSDSHIDITCNGANDGSITLVQTDNGINPLTYTISPVAGTFNAATSTFEGLPPNTYTVTATGTNGCTTTSANIVIDEPNPIVISAVAVTEFACTAGNNSNSAIITVDTTPAIITGGSGTYVIYEFVNNQGTAATGDDVIVQSGSNSVYAETNTAGGNYTINVYDDKGCVGSIAASILPFDELQSATASITNDITCNPGNDGEITINVTSTNNDATKFEYSDDNGTTYQPSNVFSGLDVGTHNFLIRHTDTGCIITASETILDPNNLHLEATKVSDVICLGGNDGEVQFDLQDNTNTTYTGAITWTLWNTNGTPANLADDTSTTGADTDGAFTISSLTAGSYYIDVAQTPDPRCTYRTAFTINGPSATITGATDVAPITCVGNNGVISIINAAGGWGGYTYFVGTAAPTGATDYVANAMFNNLAVGTYEAWIRDANGCEQMIQNNIALNDPAAITATLQINQENCTNLEGEIQVMGTSGGQGSNYSYQLIKNGTAFGASQTTTTFSGLGEGSYAVEITDQWSCTFTTAAVLLYEEMNISSAILKTIDCSLNPGGEITINTLGGSSNLEYEVTFPDGTTTITNTNGVFTGLIQPGTYNFVVRDLDTTNPVCEKTISQVLDDKEDPVLLAATIENVSCNGLSDGSITANLDPTTTANPVYNYNLYDATGTTLLLGPQTSPTFTGRAAGFYQVEVVSGRDCSVRQTVEVTEPTALLINTAVTDFTCNPDNTKSIATITVNILDGATTPGTPSGTAPYLYSIDNVNFQTSNTFDVIDTGVTQNITVYVTDGNSCPQTTIVTLEPLNVFTVTVTQDAAISCAGPEQITLSVTDNGDATNTYTYELLPIGNTTGTQTGTPTNTTATYDLTAVGGYVFRVTDTTTGCYVDTAQYDIAPYDLINVVATAKTPVTCFGDANGELEIDVTGYTGAYTYTVFAADGTPTGITGTGNTTTNPFTIGGLSGGNYYVTVSEDAAPDCSEDSNVITIVSPDMALIATVDPVGNVTCDNDKGEISVNPSGGYAPYDIQLTHQTTSQVFNATDVSGHVFTGLSAGTYDVVITDDNGCIITDTETLMSPTPIVANITPPTTVLTCFGDTNGSVTAIGVAGGEGVYQYQLNIYDAAGTTIVTTSATQTNPTFNDLGAGIYTITVSDGWNCNVETVQAIISEPTDVSSSLIEVSKLTCDDPAEILLTATGGTAPYEYSTDGTSYSVMSGGDNHTFSVGVGVYQYYVRDAFGCGGTISNQVSIDAVPALTIDLDTSAAVINCNGESTASVIAIATGGLGNYSYELLDNPTSTTPLQGPQANGTFANLAAGNYYIKVTSDGGCETVSPAIPITEPTALQIDREEFTNVSCAGENDGTITVEVSGGTGIIKYAITPNLNQFDTENVFTELEAGVYDVIAQDENGCFIPFQFTINDPAPIIIDPTTVVGETCTGSSDGSVTVSITGGTAPYSTSLDSNDPNDYVLNQLDFTGLTAGQHVVLVKDANGCDANIIVEIGTGVNLNATVTPIYECTGDTPSNSLDIVFEDPSVIPDVLYNLDTTNPAAMKLNADYTNLSAGDHTLYITHANGCVNTIDFTIEGFTPLTLALQNNNINEITAVADGGKPNYTFYFDDNNTGADNTFFVTRTDTYSVRVVDENGCESIQNIYIEFIDIEIPNYFTPNGDNEHATWKPDNTEGFPEILTIIFDRYGRELYRMGADDEGWNGLYKSKELPSGDYWYNIKLRGANDDREFIGHFTLYR